MYFFCYDYEVEFFFLDINIIGKNLLFINGNSSFEGIIFVDGGKSFKIILLFITCQWRKKSWNNKKLYVAMPD